MNNNIINAAVTVGASIGSYMTAVAMAGNKLTIENAVVCGIVSLVFGVLSCAANSKDF